MTIFHQYNAITEFNRMNRQNNSLVNKALTSATNVGEGLTPQMLKKVMSDTIIRLSPELALLEPHGESGKLYEFNRVTAAPAAGGASGEMSTSRKSNSTVQRASVTMKVIKRIGQVSDFLIDASGKYIDSYAFETEQQIKAQVWDLIHEIADGNKHAKTIVNAVIETAPDVGFDGWDKFISTNRHNEALYGTALAALDPLDDMIDESNEKGGAAHRRFFRMSPKMLSAVSRQLTNVRLNQGIIGSGLTQIWVNGGWRLNAYRDIPIVESTWMRPKEKMVPVVTLAQESAAAVGSLANGTYYVTIAPVTRDGEQEAADAQTVVLNAGTGTQRIRIALSTYHSLETYQYKVYCGTPGGAVTTMHLVKVVDAFTYDSLLSPSATPDNGTGTNYIWIYVLTGDASVPTHMASDKPLMKSVATAQVPEIIQLIDADTVQGLGDLAYTNQAGDRFNGLVVTEPLAKIDAYRQFLLKSFAVLADCFEATSVIHRGLKTK